ncbi:MAG: ABC transporter permease [Aeromicrobium sp.]
MTGREVRLMSRSPATLGASVTFPILLLLLMSASLGGVVLPGATHADYVNYALPVFVTMGVTFSGVSTALAVMADRSGGFDDRLRTLPVSPVAPLLGRIVADALRNLASVLVVTGVGVVIGFRLTDGPLSALGFVLVPVLYGVGLTWLMVAVAGWAGSAEAASSVMSALMLLASFLSTGMVRAADLPDRARPVAEANPISRVCQAMRSLAHGGPAADDVTAVLAWTVGLSLVFGLVAVRGYARRR